MSEDEGTREVESWRAALDRGDADAAWDLFIGRYRRLIFATIRHFTREHDEVMDVFAHVCEALRADSLARLRRYGDRPTHRARFSTWFVAVVRNLTVDWLRSRHGRRRRSSGDPASPAQQRTFAFVPLIEAAAVAESPDDLTAVAETARRLADALQALPPDERLAVELFVVQEMPAAAVARALRWPNAKAVYNRVYRALATLRESLERQGIGRGDL